MRSDGSSVRFNMADDLGDEWWIGQDDNKDDKEEADGTGDTGSKKRSVEEVEGADEEPGEKKKKKRKRRKITEYLEESGEKAGTVTNVMGWLNKEFEGKLSAVEMDEVKIDPERHFFEANSVVGYPVAYLKTICPKWKKQKAGHTGEGSPLVLIITSSAMRAVELNRQIQDFKGDNCKCAKLFAKHMKLQDQQKFLTKSVCHLGLGTPNRVLALLNSGHLKLDKLMAVVFDWNSRDIKKKRLADIPEIRGELTTLMKSYLIPHIRKQSSCKIGIL